MANPEQARSQMDVDAELKQLAAALIHEAPCEQVQLSSESILQVRGTRVPIDALWADFQVGATPEEVVQHYPTVALADVYAIDAWFLAHAGAVAQYIAARMRRSQVVRAQNEARFGRLELRQRELARGVR